MTWDVAAGVVIGGGALGLIYVGLQIAGTPQQPNDDPPPMLLGYVMVLAGLAVAGAILFKAHY